MLVPFRSTNRWLRGRIVERLRDATLDGWVTFGPMGAHDARAVAEALAALEREGFLERTADPCVARLVAA